MLCLFFAGCSEYNKHITGPYYLDAVDIAGQMSVDYDLGDGSGIGRIEPTVFSVGWNNRYIVAKQHPANNRTVTNFYYLDMTKDARYGNPTDSVVGPLTRTEFISKQQALGLPAFSITIKELE